MKRLFICLLAFFSLLFTSCDSSNYSKTIRASSKINDDYLEIEFRVRVEHAGDYMYFSTDKNIEEMKSVFDSSTLEVGVITTEIINNIFLFIEKKNPDNKSQYYILIKIADDESSNFRYMFTTPNGSIDSDIVLIPHHYLVYRPEEDFFRIVPNTPYEMTGTKQDFLNFYKGVFIYDITENDSSLTVEIINKDLITKFHTKNDFSIDFQEKEDKMYAIFCTGEEV